VHHTPTPAIYTNEKTDHLQTELIEYKKCVFRVSHKHATCICCISNPSPKKRVEPVYVDFDQTNPQTVMPMVQTYNSLFFSLVQHAASEFHTTTTPTYNQLPFYWGCFVTSKMDEGKKYIV
jgi:hypothetical protein